MGQGSPQGIPVGVAVAEAGIKEEEGSSISKRPSESQSPAQRRAGLLLSPPPHHTPFQFKAVVMLGAPSTWKNEQEMRKTAQEGGWH